MKTQHKILIADSRNLSQIDDNSIDLVVTSPPYPMIQMWDDLFSNFSPEIKNELQNEKGDSAFEYMHCELDKVWKELYRVVKEGSVVCINIGDATRSIGNKFQLFSNHSRIISSCKKIGFDTLPVILWRKQTNAPNKFMGSGMLPSGAYVTLEHEYILIFRKGEKRIFKTEDEKKKRMKSSFFWEERNIWFSDVWDFKGTKQKLYNKEVRDRSAAYPFELAYRLINMYSLVGDTVLDPFVGTGTTNHACMACARNSVGIEIDSKFLNIPFGNLAEIKDISVQKLNKRISSHESFLSDYISRKDNTKHTNIPHGFPVVTKQETEIELLEMTDYKMITNSEVMTFYKPLGILSLNYSDTTITKKVFINSDQQQSLFG